MIDGGSGNDTVDFSGSTAGVHVDLRVALNPIPGLGGYAQGDLISGVENVVGSDFADMLIGDEGDNRLDGGAGDDTIYGGPGNDYITGGDGDDIIVGGMDGQDSLFGGAGNDYIVAADANNDGVGSVLDGGAGATSSTRWSGSATTTRSAANSPISSRPGPVPTSSSALTGMTRSSPAPAPTTSTAVPATTSSTPTISSPTRRTSSMSAGCPGSAPGSTRWPTSRPAPAAMSR